MPCFDGVEEAAFISGPFEDPAAPEDPSPPTSAITIEDGEVLWISSGRFLTFNINVSPTNYAAAVSVNYATANGTAIAGVHYTAKSGTAVIPAGESVYVLRVNVEEPKDFTSDKTFYVNLTTPVNATIADSQGIGELNFNKIITALKEREKIGDDTPENSHQEFVSYPLKYAYLYDQFLKCSTSNQCTSHGACGVLSVFDYIHGNRKESGFNAVSLFTAAGGTPCTNYQCDHRTCPGWYTSRVLDRIRSYGASRLSGGSRSITKWNEITVGTGFSSNKGERKTELIFRIKQAIYNNGVVLVDSSWYSNWNRAGMSSASDFIMPAPKASNFSAGHTYILVGYKRVANRNVFVLQNSGGRRWAKGGRAFLPFSYIDVDVHDWSSHPTFRFYKVKA